MVGFSWGGPTTHGGGIEVWDDGIVVTTECHGCASAELTDRQTILSLYHALGDWLVNHPRSVVPPVKDVPHDH